ncbi:MAG: prolyl oligopeptidase family serine peptidase [Rariglobus sp.]|nr:S9 family peptidase [Rariglobus sp.]
MRFYPVLLCAHVLLCFVVRAEPIDSLITASDLLNVRHPSATMISPDGRTVAYTVRSIEVQPDGDHAYRNRLWIATLSGEAAPRELTAAGSNAYNPAWHPSGDRIAYVRPEASDVARIWVLPLSGGAPYAISPPLRGTASPTWSPDGKRLLFTAVVTDSELTSTPPWPGEKPSPPPVVAPNPAPAKPEASKNKETKPSPPPAASPDGNLVARRSWLAQNETRDNPVVTHRLDFHASPAADGRFEFTHVFVISQAGAPPVDLTPGFQSYTHPAWLPDNRTFVCSGPADETRHPDRSLRRKLFLVNTESSQLQPLIDSPDYSLDHPAVSPDGKQIACTAQPAKNPADFSYGQTRIATVPAAVTPEGKPKILTEKFNRSAGSPRWSADGKFLYFTAETGGSVLLHRVPSGGGNPDRITSQDTWVTDWDAGADDLALVMARPANPGELYRLSPAGRSSRILTSHNSDWLRDKKPATPERRKVKQPDGTEIDYWIVKPPYLEGGFHYPLLVMVHGGPASMWGTSNPALWHELQFFAARGYGIVFSNPRGSTGYGEKFQRESFQNWGPGPSSDVLAAATDAVAKENWIDGDRQVISGGSYGAYLTAWIISNDSRFKAAIAARGVYDLTTFLGEGDAWPLVPWHFGGYPWEPEIRKLLDAQSPITRAASINTPLLIKQNDADHQTGTAQGELLYRSLKILDRPVEFVRYPGATHDLSRHGDPSQRIDRLVRFDEFFQRFIGTPAQVIPPPPLPAVGK